MIATTIKQYNKIIYSIATKITGCSDYSDHTHTPLH